MRSYAAQRALLAVVQLAVLSVLVFVLTSLLPGDAADLRALYEDLRQRHRFALPVSQLRVAVDGAFARWDDAPRDGSEVAFIPPVSGG